MYSLLHFMRISFWRGVKKRNFFERVCIMEEVWFWLPDWASDMSLWEDDLLNVAPSADHTFISFEKLSVALDDIYQIPGLSKATTVVGWGLGALAMLRSAASRVDGQKWILLSPYADFCDESGEWTKQNVKFMARQCLSNPEPSLNTYAESFENECGDWQDDWMSAAKKIDRDKLSRGLNFLADCVLAEPLADSSNIQVLYGRQDVCVPPVQTLKLKAFLPNATFKERPKAGHWPPLLLL